MLKIHHLVLSRSDRIVWLAEELGLRYELVRHQRNPQTFRAPESLWKVSPMGKAPVIQDGDVTVCESGAIVEYLIDRHGQGRLRPAADSPEFLAYQHWMHAAESTLMAPILMDVLCVLTQTEAPGLKAFMEGEFATVFSYLDKVLSKSAHVAGAQFTGADIMVAYDLRLANGKAIPAMKGTAPVERYAAIGDYLRRIETRPAFQKAVSVCA